MRVTNTYGASKCHMEVATKQSLNKLRRVCSVHVNMMLCYEMRWPISTQLSLQSNRIAILCNNTASFFGSKLELVLYVYKRVYITNGVERQLQFTTLRLAEMMHNRRLDSIVSHYVPASSGEGSGNFILLFIMY